MKYNLDSLGPYAFEEMIQALIKKEFGLFGGTIFGTGKDGGREYTFNGAAKPNFLNIENEWDGYWVIQAKFKMPNTKEKDNLKWVKEQFLAEMKKFTDPTKNLKLPKNYIFITNIKLTGQAVVGEIDKFEEFIENYKNNIPNIHYILYDDICAMLENNRDVATAYLSFILPGDILNELFKHYEKDEQNLKAIIKRYLQKEFKADLYSKLEQSGRKTDEDVKIEDVFTDLHVTESNIIDADILYSQEMQVKGYYYLDDGKNTEPPKEKRFVEKMIELSNDSQRKSNYQKEQEIKRQNKFVLIGSAGQGKSTLTQFISQLYRAYFINSHTVQTPSFINSFIKNFTHRKSSITVPGIIRLPFRIILPDYNDWITRQTKEHLPINILSYIQFEVQSGGDKIEIDDLRNIFSDLALLIIFDGLDEVPASANRNIIVQEIDDFIDIELQQQNSDAIIIITTRPQGFKDEFNNDKFTHLKIVELSKEVCLEYLETLLEKTIHSKTRRDKQLAILTRARDNEPSARLMRTPLDATIMATLVKRGGNPPEVKYNLYKEYYTTIFDREREKEIFELDKYKNAIKALHEYLGFKLQSISEQKKESAKITHGEFKKSIEEFFLEQGFGQEKVKEKTEIISKVLVDRLVMITELTIDLDNPDNSIIGFPVAPIQEYFAALFLVNGDDKVIADRLKRISSNSYWRNVLLFVIGYFQNESRQHLISNIYMESKQDNLSINNISKVDSWLAVDILIENIFSEVPRYERLFADEINHILKLSYCDELNYLLRMPETIINEYLKKSIEKVLSCDKTYRRKATSWCIAIQIPNLFKSIIEKYWPSGADEIELLHFIIKTKSINTLFFAEKILLRLNDLLEHNSIYDIEYLLKMLTRYLKLEVKDKRLIIEYLFLNRIGKFKSNKLLIAFANNENIEENEDYFSFSSDILRKIIVTFNDSFHRELYSYKQDSDQNIKLKKIFKEYDIKYLEELIEFNLNPTKTTLNNYILSLKNTNTRIIKALKRNHQNWLLSYIFEKINSKEDLNNALKLINSTDFGNEKKWEEIEHAFSSGYPIVNNEAQDIFLRYSKLADKPNIDIINAYELFYKSLIENNKILSLKNLQLEFLYGCINSCLDLVSKGTAKRTSTLSCEINYGIHLDTITILEKTDITLNYNNSYLNIYQLLINQLLNAIKERDLNKLVEKGRDKIFSKLTIEKDESFTIIELNEDAFELVLNALNLSILSDVESSIIRLVFLSLMAKKYKCINQINIKKLRKMKYKDEQNEISRLFVLLYIDSITDKSDITENFNQIRLLYIRHKCIGSYLVKLFSMDKFKLNTYIDIITSFHKLLIENEPNNYKLLSKFETIVKNKIESQPSGFNTPEQKEKLKLGIK